MIAVNVKTDLFRRCYEANPMQNTVEVGFLHDPK